MFPEEDFNRLLGFSDGHKCVVGFFKNTSRGFQRRFEAFWDDPKDFAGDQVSFSAGGVSRHFKTFQSVSAVE